MSEGPVLLVLHLTSGVNRAVVLAELKKMLDVHTCAVQSITISRGIYPLGEFSTVALLKRPHQCINVYPSVTSAGYPI